MKINIKMKPMINKIFLWEKESLSNSQSTYFYIIKISEQKKLYLLKQTVYSNVAH